MAVEVEREEAVSRLRYTMILPPQGPSFGPAMKLSSDIESPVETFPMFILLSMLSREQDAPAGPSTCRPDRRKRLYDQADLFAVEALRAIHVGTEIGTTSSQKPIRLRLLLSGGLSFRGPCLAAHWPTVM